MTLDHLTYSTEHAAREWHRSFEWHLDVIPPLIEAIVWMTIPSIPVSRGGSRFDKLQITGGNEHRDVGDTLVSTAGAVKDAGDLWWWVNDYSQAVGEWITPTRPRPALDEKPNPDPFLARSSALLAVGWLIDHAHQVHDVAELEPHKVEMFTEIRHLRGKYGVFPKPRRQLERCDVCGERQVMFTWAENPNGSAKPIRIGRCRTCGETYEVAAPVPVVEAVVLSEACEAGAHDRCESMHCTCPHHREKGSR